MKYPEPTFKEQLKQEIYLSNNNWSRYFHYLEEKGYIKRLSGPLIKVTVTGIHYIGEKIVNNETLKIILEHLEDSYPEYVENLVFQQLLNMDDKPVRRIFTYLEETGLIEAKWFAGKRFDIKITSYGIDQLAIEKNSIIIEGSISTPIEVIRQIIEKRRAINLVFAKKFKMKLFKEHEKAIYDIQQSCESEGDFNNRIQVLDKLIDGMNTKELKKLLDQKRKGSINILSAFLEKYLSTFNSAIITNFRNIKRLRSKKYPIHSDDPKFLEATEYFEFFKFPPNWGELWVVVLCKYLESLNELLQCLN